VRAAVYGDDAVPDLTGHAPAAAVDSPVENETCADAVIEDRDHRQVTLGKLRAVDLHERKDVDVIVDDDGQRIIDEVIPTCQFTGEGVEAPG